MTRVLFLALLTFCPPFHGAEAGLWWPHTLPPNSIVVRPQVATTQIDTIRPSAAWKAPSGQGVAGSGTGSTATVDTTTVLGQQAISGALSHGGLIDLVVPSTAGMADGEQWNVANVAGTVEANNIWKIKVVDPTHVDLCATFDASGNCQGSVFTNAYQGGGTIGFNQTAIGTFSEPSYVWVEQPNYAISVLAGNGTRAWIKSVTFCLEGACKAVTAQSINPRTGTSGGWSINVASRDVASGGALDGDADLYAIVEPYNGMRRLLGPLRLHLNTNGTITRPRFYVDAVNGDDSRSSSTQASPWKTLQKALGTLTSAQKGAVIEMAAQRRDGCSVTAASPAVVTCPDATLRPPATVRLTNIPAGLSGLSSDAAYYVLPDGFNQANGSTSFEISLQPPGTNPANPETANNGTASTPPTQFGVPVATSGTGGTISVSGSVYAEDATPVGGGTSMARMVTVEPLDDYLCRQGQLQHATCLVGDVTIAQSSRSVVTGSGNQIATLKVLPSLLTLSDMTIDTSTIGHILPSSSPQWITVSNSRAIDPNGPKPPYGYAGATSGYTLLGNTPSPASTSAFLESVSSTFVAPEALVTRNAKIWASFDINQIQPNQSNFVFDNVDAVKWGNWLSGIATSFTTDQYGVAIASVSSTLRFDTGYSACAPNAAAPHCYTDVTLSGISGTLPANPANGTFSLYSGALNGKTYVLATYVGASGSSALNTSTGVFSVAGDLRAAAVGDKVFWGNEGHGDYMQLNQANGGAGSCAGTSISNAVMTRFRGRRSYTNTSDTANGINAVDVQGLLGQMGNCKITGNQIVVAGTNVTTASSPTSAATLPQAGMFLDLGSLPGPGYQRNSARIKTVTDTGNGLIMTLAQPLPGGDVPASTNVTVWNLGFTAKDFLITNSMLEENPLEFYQPQNGHQHWVWVNDTMLGNWNWRMDQAGFGLEAFEWFDSVMPGTITQGSTASTISTIQPAGASASNVTQTGGTLRPIGPGMDINASVTFDRNFVSSGVKSLRYPPVVLWDYNGALRTGSSSVGALN